MPVARNVGFPACISAEAIEKFASEHGCEVFNLRDGRLVVVDPREANNVASFTAAKQVQQVQKPKMSLRRFFQWNFPEHEA